MRLSFERGPEDDDMLLEYDLEGEKGVRGKYHEAYRQGHEVRIEQGEGSTITHFYHPHAREPRPRGPDAVKTQR